MGRNRWMDIEKLSCECCEWWFLDVRGGCTTGWTLTQQQMRTERFFRNGQKWTAPKLAHVFQIGVTIVMGYPIDHSFIGFSMKTIQLSGWLHDGKLHGCPRRLVLPPCRSLHHHQRRLFQAWKDCEDGGFHPISFSYNGRHIFHEDHDELDINSWIFPTDVFPDHDELDINSWIFPTDVPRLSHHFSDQQPPVARSTTEPGEAEP